MLVVVRAGPAVVPTRIAPTDGQLAPLAAGTSENAKSKRTDDPLVTCMSVGAPLPAASVNVNGAVWLGSAMTFAATGAPAGLSSARRGQPSRTQVPLVVLVSVTHDWIVPVAPWKYPPTAWKSLPRQVVGFAGAVVVVDDGAVVVVVAMLVEVLVVVADGEFPSPWRATVTATSSAKKITSE